MGSQSVRYNWATDPHKLGQRRKAIGSLFNYLQTLSKIFWRQDFCSSASPFMTPKVEVSGSWGRISNNNILGQWEIFGAPSIIFAAAAAKSLQSCPTLCDPIDGSPPGSPIPGILQARTLEWVAISFSTAWKWKVKVKSLSRLWLLATPWNAAYRAPQSMGFSRQEYWSEVPLPSLSIIFR